MKRTIEITIKLCIPNHNNMAVSTIREAVNSYWNDNPLRLWELSSERYLIDVSVSEDKGEGVAALEQEIKTLAQETINHGLST